MKFPISIFSQKPALERDWQSTNTNTNTLDNLNRLNTLHRSQSVPGSSVFGFKHMDHLHQHKNPMTGATNMALPDQSVLDVNSNITPLQYRDFSEYNNSSKTDSTTTNSLDKTDSTTTTTDSLDKTDSTTTTTDSLDKTDSTTTTTDSLDKTDIENGNIIIKRFSLEDSCPWEDSGFSSCGCLSDDKDDTSLKSHDCSFDSDDKSDYSNCGRPFSLLLCTRARSHSVDSLSSDLSDTTELNSKLSSSLPSDYTDFDKLFSSLDQSKCTNLTRVGVWRRNSQKVKRKKLLKSKVFTAPTNADSDHNNNWPISPSKNLHSQLRTAPFQFASAFRNHGLMSLVACICYTLFLVFLLGFLALVWHIFSRFISKKDLKELRVNLIESRQRRESATSATER